MYSNKECKKVTKRERNVNIEIKQGRKEVKEY